jgi:hypothetical protein
MDPGGTQANIEKPWRTGVSPFQRIIKTVLKALFVLLLLSRAAYADERTWPQLDDGDTKNGVCNTALAIAVSMYRSDNFFLYAPPDLRSPDFVSNFALRPEGTDVSAGDALVADWSIFQKIPKPPDGMPSPRSVYWQIGSRLGLRYVLVEDAFGWRGDQYTLFAINDDMTASQFFERSDSRSIAPLIEQTWRPPLMLREPSGEVWAIDVGPPYVTFSDWRVYSVGGDGAKKRCTMRFHGQAELGPALLPKAVQRLAQSLDRSLDDKDDGGTLHYVTGLRQYVAYLWTNIALRPQAIVKEDLDVSRTMAETEFGKWAEGTPHFRKLRIEIFNEFPEAQEALAGYYKDHLGMTNARANGAAEQALDIAFRSYFMTPAR